MTAMERDFLVGIGLGLLMLVAPRLLEAQETTSRRALQPGDLFQLREVGAREWSPDGRYVAIELSQPDHARDLSVPSSEIVLLDVERREIRTLTTDASEFLGFFNAVWSPNSERLALLSVDRDAVVQPWIWEIGSSSPEPLRDLDVPTGFGETPIAWVGDDRLAVVAWRPEAEKTGSLYHRILRGRKVADGWRRAREARTSSVTILEAGASSSAEDPTTRLVLVNLSTDERTTLLRGNIHRLQVSADNRVLRFLNKAFVIPDDSVGTYFELADDPDTMYDAVNWGTELTAVDSRTGEEVPLASFEPPSKSAAPDLDRSVPVPSPDARRLGIAPTGTAGLYLMNDNDGTTLYLCGSLTVPSEPCTTVWRANEWVRELRVGRSESVRYNAVDGSELTAWVLLPPDHEEGTRVPVVTVVYPGATYGPREPSSISVFRPAYDHPQLFAALGYAVLFPSMPAPEDSVDSHELESLVNGVLPALDAVVNRGIADPDRIAVYGRSGGGFATLGLVTQTTRFRSAIAVASYSNLTSLYGTFYGQYRYGDGGPPQQGQILRMLQMEKGYYGLGAPPWEEPDLYRAGSPILEADKVETPVMLVHGDLDFVPIQQAEEFFTALYRQDKRARFVRYQGEWHGISSQVNVLDLWKRVGNWLSETVTVSR